MFTLPEARGQGIAKALLDHVIKYGSDKAAKEEKAFAASMVVDKDNPPARALYAKCGFVPVAEEPIVPGSPRIAMLLKYAAGEKDQ